MSTPVARPTLPAQADVAIIGGGAVGLCTAYFLTRMGREVLVIDRGALQDGTSWGNAGFVVPSHVVPFAAPGVFLSSLRTMITRKGPVTWRPSLHPTHLRWLFELLRNCTDRNVQKAGPVLAALGSLSARLFPEILTDEKIECAFAPNGLLNVYGDRRAYDQARHHMQWEQQFGVPVQTVDAQQARELEPCLNEQVVGGFFYPDDAGLDPSKFMTGMLAVLAARGVSLIPSVEVLDVEGDAGRVRHLVTSRGDVQVQQVVAAAGAWTPKLAARLGNRLPIQPARGHSMTVERPQAGPRRRMLLGEKHVAVAPMGDSLRFSGMFEIGQYDTRPSPPRLAKVEANARSRLNLDAQLKVKRRWAGVRPVTPDGIPVIGPAPGWDNVMYATGHALLGLSLAPATGRVVAQLLGGQTPEVDLTRCSPERF